MWRRASLALALAVAGCGASAHHADVNIDFLVSPNPTEDPFAGAAVLDFTIDSMALMMPLEKQASYSAGQPLTVALDGPLVAGATIGVEALGIVGNDVLARGASTPLDGKPGATLSATLFFGKANRFSQAPSSPMTARSFGTMNVLPSGKAVYVGGVVMTSVGDVDIYDPATGNMTTTSIAPRASHAAAVSGSAVIVAGGVAADGTPLADVVAIHDDGSVTMLAPLPQPRYAATAAALSDGRVLLFGGIDNTSRVVTDALLLDPAGGPPTSLPLPATLVPRRDAVATSLGNAAGEILITGGVDGSGNVRDDGTLFQPQAMAFQPIGVGAVGVQRAKMLSPRVGHTATRLRDGAILIYGGSSMTSGGTVAAPEVYWPEAGQFGAFVAVAPTGATPEPRSSHVAVAFASGALLLVGGQQNGTAVLDVQRIDPMADPSAVSSGMAYAAQFTTSAQKLDAARVNPAMALLPDDTALLAGGATAAGVPTPNALLYVGCFTSLKNRCPPP